VVQDALAHLADVARTSRDLITAPNSPLRGPAQILANRAVELASDSVAWANLRAVNRG
jgi:hypothetical protein